MLLLKVANCCDYGGVSVISRGKRRLAFKAIATMLAILMVLTGIPRLLAPGGGKAFATAASFSGSGSLTDPYQIATATQLDNVRNYLGMGLYFKLTADIDLSGYSNWTPIGDYNTPFQGTMDGNGHKITNLTINSPSNFDIGLFGYISSDANIKNMHLENVNVTGYITVGALVGGNGGTISNSYAVGTVNGNANTGGLVGYNDSGTISNSYANGTVTGSTKTGGLVGYNIGGSISYSYASGTVKGSSNTGGLVGYNDFGASINNCYANATVNGNDYVGGLVGYQQTMAVINYSYANGKVTGNSNTGGLVGFNDTGSASNSFYDSQATGQWSGDPNYGVGKLTTQMKTQSTYSGWDFTKWGLSASHNNGYPYLQAIQKFVDYDGNGNSGGTVPIEGSYMPGTTFAVAGNTGNLTKTGYAFVGWNTQADGKGTDYAVGDTFTIGSTDVTLYAKWNPQYTVTYNGNGATSGSVPVDSGTYTQGVTVSVYGNTGNLARTGYTFAGWNKAADGSGSSYAGTGSATFTMGAGNVTLYAMWQSANALLSGLSVDQGYLTPAFAASELNYQVNVANVSSLNFTLA